MTSHSYLQKTLAPEVNNYYVTRMRGLTSCFIPCDVISMSQTNTNLSLGGMIMSRACKMAMKGSTFLSFKLFSWWVFSTSAKYKTLSQNNRDISVPVASKIQMQRKVAILHVTTMFTDRRFFQPGWTSSAVLQLLCCLGVVCKRRSSIEAFQLWR